MGAATILHVLFTSLPFRLFPTAQIYKWSKHTLEELTQTVIFCSPSMKIIKVGKSYSVLFLQPLALLI